MRLNTLFSIQDRSNRQKIRKKVEDLTDIHIELYI